MSIRHVNKAFLLKLPSSVRFVLLALARFADHRNDTCFPGIRKIQEMTGYSAKTVTRALGILTRLGIIDTERRNHTSNSYTLYLTGDIKAWDKYLMSKRDVVRGINKEHQATSKSSNTTYKYNLKNSYAKKGEDLSLVVGDKSPTLEKPVNLKTLAEVNLDEIPPGRRVPPQQVVWEQAILKYHKGLKVQYDSADKWALEDLIETFSVSLPLLEFIEFSVANWHKLAQAVKKEHPADPLAKYFPLYPKLSVLIHFIDDAIRMFAKEKQEAEKND